MKSISAFFVLALTLLLALVGNLPAAGLTLVVGSALRSSLPQSQLCTLTLTVSELLADVISAFNTYIFAINQTANNWTGRTLKYLKSYTGQIALTPTVGQYSGDANGWKGSVTNAARDLLVDVTVTVNNCPVCHLNWTHLNQIKDDKNAYAEVISNAAKALASNFMQTVATGFNTQNFSYSTTTAAADFDFDVLNAATGTLTTQGMATTGRVLLVNTDCASAISGDTARIGTSLLYGQLNQTDNALRMWRGVAGFSMILEWPELPSNNGSAKAVTIATTDIVTSAAHGYANGDPVVFASLTGGAGLTNGTKYYVRDITTDTFKVSATVGGAAVDVTTAYSSGTVTKTENLIAFAYTRNAIINMAGIPDEINSFLNTGTAGGPGQTMNFGAITMPETGISMYSADWQEQPTGNQNLSLGFFSGQSFGRQGYANGTGSASLFNKEGHRFISA